MQKAAKLEEQISYKKKKELHKSKMGLDKNSKPGEDNPDTHHNHMVQQSELLNNHVSQS